MEHQPFEKWIIEGTKLDNVQQEQLANHMKVCEQCRTLKANLAAVDQLFSQAKTAEPAPDFTQRWKANLARRQAEEQRRQVRKFFLILLGVLLGTVLLFGAYLALTGSPVTMLISVAESAARWLVQLERLQSFGWSLMRSLPPLVPVVFWALLACSLTLFTLIWAGCLWRISLQGVTRK